MAYIGDFAEDYATLNFKFTTVRDTGLPAVLIGGAVSVYKANDTTQSTAGITLTADFDSVVGMNNVLVDLSSDAFYAVGNDYQAVLTAGTVNSVSVVGYVVGEFSIENRFAEVTATNQVSANVTAISGDSTAADNLELQFDGTGITDGTFPATQSQLDQIALVGAAINVAASSYVLTTGTQSANTVAAVVALDGTKHEHTDAAGAMDLYYEFLVGGDGVPTSATVTGLLNSANDDLEVYAWNWGGSNWDQMGIFAGQNNTADNVARNYVLFTSHVGTGANLGKVRFRFTDGAFTLTTATLRVDQIFVSYAVVSRTVGYDGGAVWVDTINGVSGTESFVNGVADNPSDTIANANTILGNVGLAKFTIVDGSSITLAASQDGETFAGEGWTLALGGQSISGAYIHGAIVSGVASGANPPIFEHCRVGTVTLPPSMLRTCGISAIITAGAAGTYFLDRCHSMVAGTGFFTFDFAAVGNVELNARGINGGIELQNMSAGDTCSIEGNGQYVINANCAGGTLAVRGNFEKTDNSGGAVTITETARYDTLQVNAQADLALSDYDGPTNAEMEARTIVSANYFDPATDTVADVTTVANNTDMRGTDGAALATVATEARLAELDAANLPADVDNILTDTGTTLDTKLNNLQENGGYADGAIWVDTVNGTSGTTDYINGTVQNPVLAMTEANTLAASLGIARFRIASNSNITLPASQVNQEFVGDKWILVLSGVDVSGSYFEGARGVGGVTGICTGADPVTFYECLIGSTTLPTSIITQCTLGGNIVAGSAGELRFSGCTDAGESALSAVIDYGSGINIVTVYMENYSGEIGLNNFGSGTGADVLNIGGQGKIILNASSTSNGVINARGSFEIVDNVVGGFVAGGGTLNEEANFTRTNVNTEVDNALNTAIPGSPTADSVNERIAAIDDKLPTGTISDFDEATDTVDIGQINGSATSASNLEKSASAIVQGTVDTTSFSPTTTQMQTNLTEATTDHYNGRPIIWTSGALANQATDITGYSLVGGRGQFTFTATTEAPANNDTFVIV